MSGECRPIVPHRALCQAPVAADSDRWVAVALQSSVSRGRRVVEESLIALAEAVPVFLNSRPRHGRIAKLRVPLHAWGQVAGHVASCGFVADVEALTGKPVELRRRRRRIKSHRLRVRAPGQRKGQQQGPKGEPLLHVFVLDQRIEMSRLRYSATLSVLEPGCAESVAGPAGGMGRAAVSG